MIYLGGKKDLVTDVLATALLTSGARGPWLAFWSVKPGLTWSVYLQTETHDPRPLVLA